MFAMMKAFLDPRNMSIWTTTAPNANYCTTLHIIEMPVGVIADDVERAIFAEHNFAPRVKLAIGANKIFGFINVRCFGDALLGDIYVADKWVAIDKYKNVKQWNMENVLQIKGNMVRAHFAQFNTRYFVILNDQIAGFGVITFASKVDRNNAKRPSGTTINGKLMRLQKYVH